MSADSLIEKIRNVSHALRAISRLFGEHAKDQFLQGERNILTQAAERWWGFVQVFMNERADRSVIKRQRVREHLIKNDAERVNVGSAVYIFSEFELLRTGVLRRSHR
jgi:hypothetical protein